MQSFFRNFFNGMADKGSKRIRSYSISQSQGNEATEEFGGQNT